MVKAVKMWDVAYLSGWRWFVKRVYASVHYYILPPTSTASTKQVDSNPQIKPPSATSSRPSSPVGISIVVISPSAAPSDSHSRPTRTIATDLSSSDRTALELQIETAIKDSIFPSSVISSASVTSAAAASVDTSIATAPSSVQEASTRPSSVSTTPTIDVFHPPPSIPSVPPPTPASEFPQNPQYLPSPPPSPPLPVIDEKPKMSDLQQIHTRILSSFRAKTHRQTLPLLSSAKLILIKTSTLLPTPKTPQKDLLLVRDILEIGALTSIHVNDTDSFSRYYSQLVPFYELSHPSPAQPTPTLQPSQNQGKILGLHLLLLLSRGDTADFHSTLEILEEAGQGDREQGWQWGEYVRYPVMLERWLMEGSYDKVWEATRKSKTPTEEYDIFTKILVSTIRQEIATSAERAYPSLPIANAKILLFLDTEKEVLTFARERDWDVKDGRIYFPEEEGLVEDRNVSSGTIIENTIGYANELEQIV